MRLFLAIQLSPAVREALLTAEDTLRRQGRGSFPPPENLHLTLAFLGETEDPAGARAVLSQVSCRPFSLAVEASYANRGGLIWISSSAYLDDMYNAYSSGANVNFTMNAVSQLIGESETLSIRAKSLNYNYLTISDSVSGLLQVLMIGLIPLAFLGAGIAVVVRRRRLQK